MVAVGVLTGAGVDSVTGVVGAAAAVGAGWPGATLGGVCSGAAAGVVSGVGVAGAVWAGGSGSCATAEGTPRSGATGTGTVDCSGAGAGLEVVSETTGTDGGDPAASDAGLVSPLAVAATVGTSVPGVAAAVGASSGTAAGVAAPTASAALPDGGRYVSLTFGLGYSGRYRARTCDLQRVMLAR